MPLVAGCSIDRVALPPTQWGRTWSAISLQISDILPFSPCVFSPHVITRCTNVSQAQLISEGTDTKMCIFYSSLVRFMFSIWKTGFETTHALFVVHVHGALAPADIYSFKYHIICAGPRVNPAEQRVGHSGRLYLNPVQKSYMLRSHNVVGRSVWLTLLARAWSMLGYFSFRVKADVWTIYCVCLLMTHFCEGFFCSVLLSERRY